MEKLPVDDAVAKFIPEFAAEGKGAITVRDLLVDRSGMIPNNLLNEDKSTPLRAHLHAVIQVPQNV